jgi:hypothetical protein
LLLLALLPVAAAVSPEAIPPSRGPIAVAQPLAALGRGASVTSASSATLPESGLLVVVGGGLMGLAALVRRTGRAS